MKTISCEVSELVGKTLIKIIKDCDDEYLVFVCSDGTTYKMYHEQDCCEFVWLEDINGNFNDLIGSPIVIFDEREQQGDSDCESSTWTFYKIATIKGYVDLRWVGQSNGYYSESVNFVIYE